MMKHGFTLVELLAVMVILGIILILAIPKVSESMDIARKEAFIENEEEIVRAAESFIIKNIKYIPRNIGDTKEIKLVDLQNEKFINTLVDPKNNKKTCNGYVLVTKVADKKYNYVPHLNCEKNIGSAAEDGLLAHYTFDDFEEPTENLYQGPSLAGRYIVSAYDGDYDFGTATNSQWVIDNSDQPIKDLDVQKISRIESGISQRLYVYWGEFITNSTNGVTFTPGAEKTVSFYYYGTYGISLSPYIGGHTGSLALYSDNATSGNGTEQLSIPVTEKKWNRVTFKIKNIGTTDAIFNWGWMVLHANNIVVTLNNSEFWKFTGVQVESKSYSTPYVDGTRTGIVKDYSSNSNTATLQSNLTPKWTNNSIIGEGAYEFNGTEKVISTNSVTFGTNLSFCFWIKPSSTDVEEMIMHGNYNDGAFEFYKGGTTVVLRGGATAPQISANALTLNKWNYLCGTINGTNGKIYINGILKNGGTVTAPKSTSYPISIGAYNNLNYPFEGSIDDVRLYNRALTDTEIKHYYDIESYKINKEGNQ